MTRPVMLDLFCGGGGCAMGYHRAGWEVVGVDHVPQRRYPFGFVQADALEYLDSQPLDRFAAIHASPPCQAYSRMSSMVETAAPQLIEEVRERLQRTGKPYVIENVEGSPLQSPLMLCGTMFGLRVRRHRLFEIHPHILILTPSCNCLNGVVTGRLIGHRCGGRASPGRTRPPAATESMRREAIGVPWMSARQARQAIPPAYTEFIGRHLLQALEAEGVTV